MEGILGSLGLTDRNSALLAAALFHGFSFILAVIGKYQSKLRARSHRALDHTIKSALAEREPFT